MIADEIVKPVLMEGLINAVHWYRSVNSYYLQSIFDQVGFVDRKPNAERFYALPAALTSKVRYPVKGVLKELAEAKDEARREIEAKYKGFDLDYLENLTANQLLFLLENTGQTYQLMKQEMLLFSTVTSCKPRKK